MAKRVIYAEDLTEALRDDPNIDGANFKKVMQHIKEAPGIVVCKECRDHEPSDVRNWVWCKQMCRYMKEEGFCSEGGRKEDG